MLDRMRSDRTRPHGSNPVAVHQGKALAAQGVIEENLGGERGHPARIPRYDLYSSPSLKAHEARHRVDKCPVLSVIRSD